jgi:hypothetical protein
VTGGGVIVVAVTLAVVIMTVPVSMVVMAVRVM